MGIKTHMFGLVLVAISEIEGEICVILAWRNGKQQVVPRNRSYDLVPPSGIGFSRERVARYPPQLTRFRNQHHYEPSCRLLAFCDLSADRTGVVRQCNVAIQYCAHPEYQRLRRVILPCATGFLEIC